MFKKSAVGFKTILALWLKFCHLRTSFLPSCFISALLWILLAFILSNHVVVQYPFFYEYKIVTPVQTTFSSHRKKASLYFLAVQPLSPFISFSLVAYVPVAQSVTEDRCMGHAAVWQAAPIELYLVAFTPNPWLRMGRGSFSRKFRLVFAEGGRINVEHQAMDGL